MPIWAGNKQAGRPMALDPAALPVLQNLGKPGSHPPASPLSLQRQIGPTAGDTTGDPAAAFLDDLAPQLAVAFAPQLGANLYTALANSVTRRTRRFQGVHALRARSAPFGHNAPRRTILNADGTVAGAAEWPLAFERATIRFFPVISNPDEPLLKPTIEVRFETQDSSELTVYQVGVGPTGSTRITVTPVGDSLVKFVITLPGPKLTKIELNVDRLQPPVIVIQETIDGTLYAALSCPQGKTASRIDQASGYLAIGFNAQGIINIVSEVRTNLPTANRNVLRLDTTNDKVVPGGYVIVQRADDVQPPLVARIEAVATVSPTDFGLSGTVTQLTLDQPWLRDGDATLASLSQGDRVRAE